MIILLNLYISYFFLPVLRSSVYANFSFFIYNISHNIILFLNYPTHDSPGSQLIGVALYLNPIIQLYVSISMSQRPIL